VSALIDAEIPVMGHIGLTPQSVLAMGGFKVQGKDADAAAMLVDDAVALADAGCFSIVLEGVPDRVARMVTEAVPVPTIGIGAGRWCDGQVLVFHDVVGLEDRIIPKFVRRYASLKADGVAAVGAYCADVRAGRFPSDEESYHLAAGVTLGDEMEGLYGVAVAAAGS
jgi:3-methyl-2-oxobutanoate hydroxymethyltransferase